ncbi:MAG: hypothetical protein KAU20_05910 [Nanoarchaeota archaeon]|nr:hypothetical protein [Nanoarchaeota archaeon]
MGRELRDEYYIDISQPMKALNTLAHKSRELQKTLQKSTTIGSDKARIKRDLANTERAIKGFTTRVRKATRGLIGKDMMHSGLIRSAMKRETTQSTRIWKGMCNKIKTLWKGTTNKMTSGIKKVRRTFNTMAKSNISKTKQMNRGMREGGDLLQSWWKRFGEVGLGFTFIYRGVNAIENALGKFVESMKEAITLSGEFVEIQARMAVSATLFGSNAVDFSDAFTKAHANMLAFREACVGAISTVAELGQGIDEAAQWGIIVEPQHMKNFVRFLDFINIIATTTGNAGRQIRQEIQSLHEGSKRVGNILIKIIDRLAKSGAQFSEHVVKDIVAGGERGKKAFFEVVEVIGNKMKGLYVELAKASPTYAYTVGWQKYLISIQKLIIKAVPIARDLGFLQKNAADTSNIFAVAVNRAFKQVNETMAGEKFQKALSVNMISFCELLQKVTGLTMKMYKTILYLGVAIRGIPSGVKEFGGLIAKALAFTMALWGIKSIFGVVIGMTMSAFRPVIMLSGALIGLAGAGRIAAKATEEEVKAIIALRTATMFARITMVLMITTFLLVAWAALVVAKNIEEVKDGIDDLNNKFKESYEKHMPKWAQAVIKFKNKISPAKDKSFFEMYPGFQPSKASKKLGGWLKDSFKDAIDELDILIKKVSPMISKLGSSLTKGVLGDLDLADEKSWKDFQTHLKGIQAEMKGLTTGLADEISSLKTNMRSLYEKAIKSGDLSLAVQLIPYVKSETIAIIHTIEEERRKLIKSLAQIPKEAIDMRARIINRLAETALEIKAHEASIRDMKEEFIIMPWEEKHAKAAIDRIKKRLKAEADFAKKRIAAEEKIQGEIIRMRDGGFEHLKWQLAKQVEGYRKLGVSEILIAEWVRRKKEEYVESVKNKTKKTTTLMENMWEQACKNMQDAFGKYFVDAVSGKLKNLKDYVLNFLTTVRNAMAQALGAKIGGTLMTALGNVIGMGGGTTTSSASTSIGGFTPHFEGIPHLAEGADFYTKGITPMIAGEAGTEHVQITPVGKETKPDVQINVINKTQPVSAKQGAMRFDGRKWVIDVVLDALGSQPSFRNAIRSV